MPVHITIEPTTACNAKCPVCETGANVLGRAQGNLGFEHFKRVMDEVAPYTNTLLFYFMGEPFLNKSSYDMIRYAKEKGIYVATSTNGDFVDPQRLVDCGVDLVYFQIGGMTQKTHETYRVASHLDKILPNLGAAIAAKRQKYGSRLEGEEYRRAAPEIAVGLIVMKHNEHEIPEFLDWGNRIGADRVNIVPPVVRTVAQGRQLLPNDSKFWVYDYDAFQSDGVLEPKPSHHNDCTLIWNSTVITWNGDVVPCCRDPRGKFVMGNVFETPLKQIWNNKKYRAFRKRILTNQSSVGICRLCTEFTPMIPK